MSVGFDRDAIALVNTVLGPATRGLRAFPVVRRGESLYIQR
ncbi:MAG: hypothetical protein Q8P18_01770 [Pseudomonadota bacterium]|nr:hypothetical protein [Pseudomonadota bacterium]